MKKIIRNNIDLIITAVILLPLAAVIALIWITRQPGITGGFAATIHTIWAVFGYLFALLLICAMTAAINDIVTKHKNKKKR